MAVPTTKLERQAATLDMMNTVAKRVRSIPGGAGVVVAAFQRGLNGCSVDHVGILLNVDLLFAAVMEACGVCKKLLFVCSGCGCAEYAVAETLRRAAFDTAVGSHADFKTVFTDGMAGRDAIPAELMPPWVLKMTADAAIEAFGDEETAVVCINPPPDVFLGLAASAKRAGVAGIFVWMETVTEALSPDELAVGLERLKASRGLTDAQAEFAGHCILHDDCKPKSTLSPGDWAALNGEYARFCLLPEHSHRWSASTRRMSWNGFVLRPPSTVPSEKVDPPPLPALAGDRLDEMLVRYVALVKRKKK